MDVVPERVRPGDVVARSLVLGGVGLWGLRPAARRRRAGNAARCGPCRRRQGRQRRARYALAALVLPLAAVAVVAGVRDMAPCYPVAYQDDPDYRLFDAGPEGVWVPVRTAVTGAAAGSGLAYSWVRGGGLCRFTPESLVVARVGEDEDGPRAGFMLGHVFVTEGEPYTEPREIYRIGLHESRHVDQTAAATLAGGPLAFPLGYAATETFFPGSRNLFERGAGLADGRYDEPDGPGPASQRLLLTVAAVAVLVLERRRLRRWWLLWRAAVAGRARRHPELFEHTHPVPPGRVGGVLHRAWPRAAQVWEDRRRLGQHGCPACGTLPPDVEDRLSDRETGRSTAGIEM